MYKPRPSHYCKIPSPRYIRHPLDAIYHRSTHHFASHGPMIAGRKVLPIARNQEKIVLPKPKTSFELPLYIDSSMLSLWRSCHRKHFWSTIRGLYPTGQSVHLIAGGAVAGGLEAARRFCFAQPDPANVPHEALLVAAYPSFHDLWGDYEPPADNPRNAKTFANTFAALANYLEEFHPGRDPVQPLIREDGTPAVEYRFAIPLPILHPSGDPFLFVGRFDMFGSYRFGHEKFPVVLDEKTAQSFTFDWANKWDLRGQFIGYVWALRQQGYNISHAVPRGIAIQKTQYDNRTTLVMYPDHIIEAWYQQLLRDVEAIKSAYHYASKAVAIGDDPKQYYSFNFADACDAYGGCAFRTLCNAYDPEPFTSNYVLHRWNPLALQPVEESPSSGST